MLREISVQNLAIIEEARLELSGSMTALTGETGAGKSLVADAIELALGDRADSNLVASDASKAVITVVFDCPHGSPVAEELQRMGFVGEDEAVYLSREITASGRSQSRINGSPAPASAARTIGELLVDLHGQHEHQTLLRPPTHRDVLDAWIGPDASAIRAALATLSRDLREAREHIEKLKSKARERERLIDLHRFELDEIEKAGLMPGEEESLGAERKRMMNAEKLADEAGTAAAALTRSDRSASDCLSLAEAALERAAALDPSLEAVLEELRSARVVVQEAGASVAAYAGSLEFDPERLQIVADRLDQISRLKRKYGNSVDEILAYAEKTAESLSELESSEESLASLQERERELHDELIAQAGRLSHLRSQAAGRFAKETLAHLKELAMENARFEVSLTEKPPDAFGAETVEFLFSANPGHPPKPLARIASGGEISRVMLALRCVLAASSPASAVVFDEVDAGLGGQTAAIVGRKLRELSRHNQVLVITHLPQIASQADEHFRVDKQTRAGRTHVTVERLEADQRVQEVARMLGGGAAAQVALDHAREMLAGYSPNKP
jgi:DNA repair protein RecN (Recombination protein N)